MLAILRVRHAEPLPPRTVHAHVEQVQAAPGFDDVWIADAAFIPTTHRSRFHHRPGAPGPPSSVAGCREANAGRISCLIPIPEAACPNEGGAIRGNIIPLPGAGLRR